MTSLPSTLKPQLVRESHQGHRSESSLRITIVHSLFFQAITMSTETLTAAGSSSVQIHHHGAHITSFTDSSGREIMYTSPTAVYDGKKAIRGGIPICFPQFGKKGPLRQHGFARNLPWELDTSFPQPEQGAAARFLLKSNEETLASEWNYAFQATYTVSLAPNGNAMTIDMNVTNKDERPFSITTALHSYFLCPSESTKLIDFDGVRYIDSIDHNANSPKTQQRDVEFGKEVDRVYINTPNTIKIPSVGVTIRKTNLPEAVVWNPHIAKAAAMGDMPDDDWRTFICIEPARTEEAAVVQPGDTWSCQVVVESNS